MKTLLKKFSSSIVLVCFLSICLNVSAQVNPPGQPYNEKRVRGVVILESTVAAAALTGLYYLWYKKYPHSHFHFFNDNREWLIMDKIGHAVTAYNISSIQYNIMRWSGVNNNQAILIGGLTAIGFQAIIEIFDGFSEKWGFSPGDMLANFSGSALFMAQQYGWNDQRIRLKFSYHNSIFSKYNPNELGWHIYQRWLKDYNGQTYWLSITPVSFLNSKSDFPNWLAISFGYGARGMIGPSRNPGQIDGITIPEFKRIRQFYFSADADLNKLGSKMVTPQMLLSVPNVLKIPAPALEFKSGSPVKFKSFYF